MPEPMIISDPELRLPADSDFWTSPEMFDEKKLFPSFSVGEVAKSYLGYSDAWVRFRLRTDPVEVDGQVFQPPRTAGGHRYFRLYDIEVWAHALAEAKLIDGRRLELIINAVRNTARLHGFIS